MELPKAHTLAQFAAFINAEMVGDENHQITGINEIHKVVPGDLVFVDHPKYYDKALHSAATTILIDKKVECPEGKALLVSEQPFHDFNKLTKHFKPFRAWDEKPQITVGLGTRIHPTATVGHGVSIGQNCFIHPGVVIEYDTVIGDNVIIHSNAVLGADAFYYKKIDQQYNKMHTCGRVILEDNVEIGALVTVDRGVTGDTIIGAGSKLDNHVHIGHDTVIGKNCLFAAQVGIAGCVIIEDNVVLWGQVGVPSDLTIGEGAVVLGQSGLTKSVEGGKTYFGSPASEAREKFKELALIRKIPGILERLP
ncbi:MAG: UDP-3-O-(3-hydroxymyristoyl)glucosamine N-acyltransferase [Bacteroidota bacterium]